MKCYDIIISFPVEIGYRKKDELIKLDDLFTKYDHVIRKEIERFEVAFNKEEWPIYHSAKYRYENRKLIISLVSYTSILCRGLSRELFPFLSCKNYDIVLYSNDDTSIYITPSRMESNIDLKHYVYYIDRVRYPHNEYEITKELQEHLLEQYPNVEINFEFLSTGIFTLGVKPKSLLPLPYVINGARAFLDNKGLIFHMK